MIGDRQYVKRMYDPTRDRFLDRDSGDNRTKSSDEPIFGQSGLKRNEKTD